jgi:hypothetical protein
VTIACRLSFDDDVAGLLFGVAKAVLGDGAADPRADTSGELSSDILAWKLDADSSLLLSLYDG